MKMKLADKDVWLNFHHLYYFYIIAKEGSISKASKVLSIGQPTLSIQMKQFEAQLNKQLFNRDSKRMNLSEEGNIVFQYAEEIFSLGQSLGNIISQEVDKKKLLVGIISGGVSKILVMEFLKKLLMDGKAKLQVIEGTPEELLSLLKVGKLDLILTNTKNPSGNMKGFSTKKILSTDVVICGTQKFHPLKTQFPMSLAGHPFVMPLHGSKLRFDLENYFNLNLIKIEVVGESQDTGILEIMAMEGMGMLAIPACAFPRYAEKGLIEIGRIQKVKKELFYLIPEDARCKTWLKKILNSLKLDPSA